MNNKHLSLISMLLIALFVGIFLLGCNEHASYDASAKPFTAAWLSGEKAKLPNSAVYDGDYRDGLFHGEGTLVWRNGTVYEGEFANGMMHGTGIMEYASGDRYEGEFANGMMEGTGKLVSAQGDVYNGKFVADNFHGKGRYEHKDGDAYEGDFLIGQFTGKGTIIYTGIGEYQGEVKDWKMHGQGVYTKKEKSTIYSGTFVSNTPSGAGEIITQSGDHYTGNIENWTADGQGELKRSNGVYYIGEFKAGVYSGQGKITYKNKNTYEGEFEYGMRHGQGTLIRAKPKGHKKRLAGWWQYDSYHGEKKPLENASQKTKPKNSIDAESIFYRQPGLLERELDKLKMTTPSVPDLYMINFAGYSRQDVFMKEAQYARKFFDEKFGTKGRSLTLINNHKVADQIPMASVTNLDRSIKHVAEIMDKDQDILFLFLTSHGSDKHELSVSMEGLPLNDLPAEKLASIVKNSGIKWKVIIVSSCYSGGFIKELKDEHTMVLTASRADHVSFGCSDAADFTFFGRAFFKNALADATSFTQAFKQARDLVSQWEDEEKYDHSDPQIWTSKPIEKQLALWKKSL